MNMPLVQRIDVLVALQNARHQFADLRIHHRLAAADGNHRRAALIHRRQALFERHALGDGGFVFANAPAARAGEIAGVQRLQHQHDGEALVDHGMRLALLTGLGGQDTERDWTASALGTTFFCHSGRGLILFLKMYPAMPAVIESGNLIV